MPMQCLLWPSKREARRHWAAMALPPASRNAAIIASGAYDRKGPGIVAGLKEDLLVNSLVPCKWHEKPGLIDSTVTDA